jgi:putative Holliday junction resolvase
VSAPGRLLGVDYGSVRVGLAVSDRDRRIASPLATYTRRCPKQDAAHFRAVVRKEEIVGLIVGLPVHMDGRVGEKAVLARAFGKWLGELTALPVVFWDERFTTVEAEGLLLSAGLTNKRRKARRDRVAAQVLLRSYLEAGCPEEGPLGPLDGS